MIRDGFYKIYTIKHDEDGCEHHRLMSRIYIDKGFLHHLEDHSKNLHTFLPEGLITNRIMMRLNSLKTSGYYLLVHEEDIKAGHHPHLVKPFDIGPIKPDKIYNLTGHGIEGNKVVEVWPEAVSMDGKTLSDMELREVMDKVKDGSYILSSEV